MQATVTGAQHPPGEPPESPSLFQFATVTQTGKKYKNKKIYI